MPREADKPSKPIPPVKPAAPPLLKPSVPATVKPGAAPEAPPADFKPAALGKASDEDLMRRTQNGDKQAFAIIYERYNSSVLSYLYRMLGNVEDVESVGQEVFLRAFRFAPTYKYPQKLSTWLFTITRNLAINQSRRKKRSPVRNVTELNLDGVDSTSNPLDVAQRASDDVEKKEEIARVLKALEDLPVDQKEVIMLGIFQDLSYAEMEEITGTKAVTLRSRMFHGLRKLARMLGVERLDVKVDE
jgi:RNA polymerase sigma-70 factor, ECF subfamily